MRTDRSWIAALMLPLAAPGPAHAATQPPANAQGPVGTYPASARAHYAEAELYARESKTAQGLGELAQAERLDPGLPFADVYSMASLDRELALGPPDSAGAPAASLPAPGIARWLPVLRVLALAMAVAGLWLAFRPRRRR